MTKRRSSVALVALLVAALAAALAGQERPLYFIQMTDPQFGMYTSNQGFEQETANFEFAIATANRLEPAFVIVTGDLVNKAGDGAQVDEYLRIAQTLQPSIPVYHVAGNHDVENVPTPASLAAYRRSFGRDWYSFRSGPLFGIVLNSALMQAPTGAPDEAAAQDNWLAGELAAAGTSGARLTVVFLHHPLFTQSADEKDEYHNIPAVRRATYLAMFRKAGVRWVFAGHYHQNAIARDGDLEMVTTGPVGSPLGRGRSGMRFVSINGGELKHVWRDFGDLPANLSTAF
jgi:3',5'-cyclic AMP phosphodiesterase CpdA